MKFVYPLNAALFGIKENTIQLNLMIESKHLERSVGIY